MDKVRSDKKKNRKPLYIGGTIAAMALITLGLARLKPALPTVDAGTIWPDTIKRGSFVREVKGPGTLVPEDIRIVTARTSGRVEEVFLRPGQTVQAGTLLMRMTNPDVQKQLLDAQNSMSAAQSQLITLKASLQGQILQQKSAVASAKSAYNDAVRLAKVNTDLAAQNLIARNEVAKSNDLVEEQKQRL